MSGLENMCVYVRDLKFGEVQKLCPWVKVYLRPPQRFRRLLGDIIQFLLAYILRINERPAWMILASILHSRRKVSAFSCRTVCRYNFAQVQSFLCSSSISQKFQELHPNPPFVRSHFIGKCMVQTEESKFPIFKHDKFLPAVAQNVILLSSRLLRKVNGF